MTAGSFYEQKTAYYTQAVRSSQKKIRLSAFLRTLTFLVFCFSGYYVFKQFSIGLLLLSLLFLLIFFFLVAYAWQLKEKKALEENLLFVNNNESGMLHGEPNQMDDGRSFLKDGDYADDLDIFGPGSLFHLINRCTTSHGKSALSSLLLQTLPAAEAIEQRQQAVQVFAGQPERRQLITAGGLMNKDKESHLHGIEAWSEPGKSLHRKKLLRGLRWLLPLYNIPAFLYYIATGEILYIALGAAVAWIITGRYSKYITRQHQLIGKKQQILKQYASILKDYAAVDAGTSSLLQQLRLKALDAHRAIHKLAKISSLLDQRLNLLVNFFLNTLIVYDLQCILTLDQWKEKYQDQFEDWLHTAGHIECLNALAGFAFNNPRFAYPSVAEGSAPFIEARQMAHPLISETSRIGNDLELGKSGRLLLITGSNMSGKTTFLRTLGVNLILAQSGAPVCAERFVFTPMEIFTSIRISDSLHEQTSYFMAELKRLQQIILRLKNGKPALVLIDEILRGTNSGDKTSGSEQFIKQLLQYNCLTLFATHDLVLASLEDSHKGVIGNYCFESVIRDGVLHFDYTLRRGVARNKNASFLMRKMGIIEGDENILAG
ncbi:MAG: hypothetical protein M9933_01415 [Chitinophagaceae bacterium]|nr:hypothetical protein [Chitinophagaceae bacterium]